MTLEQRKRREAMRKAGAAEEISAALTAYARAHGGRFLLYGSAAAGRLRRDSDLDILLDFPDAAEGDAWRFAEELCWRHGVTPNIFPLPWCTPTFRDKVVPGARLLG